MSAASAASVALEQALGETEASEPERLDRAARLVLAVFDDFYGELRECPYRAQRAFEGRDPARSVALSHERLNLYSGYVARYGARIARLWPALAREEGLWEAIDARYRPLIAARYEADIAYAFLHSIRRNVLHGLWRPVSYRFERPVGNRARARAAAHQRFTLGAEGIDATLVVTVLHMYRFRAPWRDLDGDARAVAGRWGELARARAASEGAPRALDVLEAGFFRDLRAFVVGRVEWASGARSPFVLALERDARGIGVEALLHETADVHNLCSSTLANFHVTSELYYQIAVFLETLMPLRPLGLHYSTIGYNHVGKVAILEDIARQIEASGERFARSPGADGTVAIGFTFPRCTYHLKVIRDRPTREYKWGEFAGVDAVLEKYRRVHGINRTGSMLDNVMYFSLPLPRAWFDEALLETLAAEAGGTVEVGAHDVLFRPLIVQLKIVPLPVHFEVADVEARARVVESLGHCIRNNVAAGVFNKDLDARNYGVGRYGKVFLFDYDAIEPLAEVEIASNADREAGEEEVPEWFFSDRHVFLPEELVAGLMLPDRASRERFRRAHAALETPAWWRDAQSRLARGEVLAAREYPEARRLDAEGEGRR